MATEGSR